MSPEQTGAGRLPYQDEYDSQKATFASIQEMAEMDLYGPFESAVVRQICRPNPDFVPDGRFFERTGEMVSQRSMPADEEIFDLGVDIGASIDIANHTPRNKILGYLNSCLWMDNVKVGFAGTKQTTKLTHAVQTYARRQLMDSLPLDSRTLNMIELLRNSIASARELDQANDDVFAWISTKLEFLYIDYRNLKKAHENFSRFYDGVADDLSHDQIQEIDEGVRLLNRQSMQARKYGTKPAYTEASIGGSWIFYDGEDYRQNILRRTRNIVIPPAAAVVLHSPLDKLQDIRFGMGTLPMGAYADIKVFSGGVSEAKPDFMIVIGMDGRMSIDFEGLQTIDDVLRDDPKVAKMLVAEIASIFYDLSMPIDIRTPQHQPNFATMSDEERQNFNPVNQLLIPRLRRIYDPDTIVETTERTVREHDVTWFVRLLPPGWHASPEAGENARRVGITLGPNETFVREHKRGTGNAVLGYHAVRRTTDLKRGEDY